MKPVLCAFNVSRQSFVHLAVEVADTLVARWRGLAGRSRHPAEEALWVVPAHGVHTFGLRFPIDVVFLDSQGRVIHLVESLGSMRIAGIRWNCTSVLQLPPHTIHDSDTRVGDRLLVCAPEKLFDPRTLPEGTSALTPGQQAMAPPHPSALRWAMRPDLLRPLRRR